MNKVMLIGNVGTEPDVRYYAADQCVAHVRLATTERGYTLPNGTQVPDKTDWHSLTFSKGLAKVVERYVHKGDKLYVEGRLRYNITEDKRGQRATVVDILVENMEMLTPRAYSQQQQKTAPSAEQENKRNDAGDSRPDINENKITLPF
ncbi:MAG: single-stranded DNA-binding protein [Bacteroidales bacterium]|nr:single-stranded DNA-binding protein [Bacteroidales bacterium]MDY4925708.1 single-stranded DNA-binding protein [Prevotella sp.]MDY5032923.1 single-stranded DNA-binding protein [Prevotella sp.]